MIKTLLLFLLLFCGCDTFRLSSTVKNLDSYSIWLKNSISYKSEKPSNDYWQTPKETIKLKTGDCEDFALLNHKVLKELNIESKIYLLYFYKINAGHCLVVYNNDNEYSIIDCYNVKYEKFDSPLKAILFYYPEVEEIEELKKPYYGKNPSFYEKDLKQIYKK